MTADRRRRVVSAYAIVFGGTGLIAALRLLLAPILGDIAPLILFLIPVALSAWVGGFGPGILATVVGLLVGLILFSPRNHYVGPTHGWVFNVLARAVPFTIVGGAVSLMADQLESARERAATAAHEARAAESAARRGEDAQRRVFESVRDFAIFTTDLAGRITTWNAGAQRLFGYPEDAAIGMAADELFTPEDRAAGGPARERAAAATTAAAGRSADDHWLVRQDGSRFFANGSVTPLWDDAGTVVGFTKVAHDVTERHRTRQQLTDARRRADMAGLAGDVGTFEWDVTADRVFGDENFGRIFDVRRDPDGSLPLAGYTAAIHPEDRSEVSDRIGRSVQTGADFEAEYRVLAGGRERWVLARGRPETDGAGRVVRFPGVVIDITDRKRADADRAAAEAAVRESEARYRDLFTRMDEGYCIIEVLYDGATGAAIDYRYELVNPAFEGQTGLRDVVGRTQGELTPGHESHWAEAYGRVATTGRSERFTQEAAAVGGSWFDVFAFRVGDPDGRRVAVLFNNVTERKRAERDREAALATERQLRSVAEQASRMKDDFLATVSHELRTPLNAIVGWTQLMDGQGLEDPATVREGLEVIGRNAALQSRLIEDILDMSRITSGKLRLNVEPLDARVPLTAAVETVRPAAEAKGLVLEVDGGPDPIPVSGDVDRLQQVFWNLLANAIKFSDGGGRVVATARRSASRAVVMVVDGGRGMSAGFLPFVFDRFRQADMSTTRRAGGLGLGLSIVHQLVEMHGGTVRAASDGEGLGSTFTVELPVSAVAPATASRPTRSPLPAFPTAPVRLDGRRVLALDDEPDARRVIQATLTRAGAEVTVVPTVADAIGVLTVDPGFDLILSDIGMPGEDGYAFIRRLRHLERQRRSPPTPAVALTALTRPSDRAGVLAAGFDRYLSKPVQSADLLRAADELVLGRERRDAGAVERSAVTIAPPVPATNQPADG